MIPFKHAERGIFAYIIVEEREPAAWNNGCNYQKLNSYEKQKKCLIHEL